MGSCQDHGAAAGGGIFVAWHGRSTDDSPALPSKTRVQSQQSWQIQSVFCNANNIPRIEYARFSMSCMTISTIKTKKPRESLRPPLCDVCKKNRQRLSDLSSSATISSIITNTIRSQAHQILRLKRRKWKQRQLFAPRALPQQPCQEHPET